ncbi:MAG: diguanylate cyclase [Motiliproteus sp.]
MDVTESKYSSALKQKKYGSLFHGRPFLGAICIGLVILLGATLVKQAEIKTDTLNQQRQAEKRVRDAAASLSSSMIVRLNLTSSLNAFVTTRQDFSAQEFDSFASMLLRDLPGVMSLQLAPNGIVTYLTDLERNRKALGHNLLADPNRRAIAEKSIRDRNYIIAGPINLVQGGRAIIARRPIFIPAQNSATEIFWGFATVLIEVDSLLSTPLFNQLSQDFNVSIRGKDGLGAKGEIFYGDQSTFDSAVAVSDIGLPDALWQLAVSNNGSHVSSGFIMSIWFWAVSAIAAAFGSIVVYSTLDRPRQLEQDVNKATERLSKEVKNRINAEEQALHMAQHDSLTGLPNRRLFDELSKHSISTAKREGLSRAILFVDIDGFKKINDSFGHAAGDQVLVMIAERLLERVRESDIVARFGGDEFVVLLTENCDVAGTEKVASEIIIVISQPFDIGGRAAGVGASIGIAIYPDHGTCIENLLQKSDAAMYLAKESGKNCYRLSDCNQKLASK